MFVLGHIGIGRTIVGPIGRALPIVPFAIGALLPDAIDKPLYYAHVSSYVSCTRTFGHTGLFFSALVLTAWARRSRVWAAVALGVATHTVLDGVLDAFSQGTSSVFMAFTWPFVYTYFASYDFESPLDQLGQVWRPRILITEAIGLALLAREYWQRIRAPRT
jgi:hypothetical protein